MQIVSGVFKTPLTSHKSVQKNLEAFGSGSGLFGIAVSGMGLEPRASPKWTVAGKIRNRHQVTTLNV
jgi:hypothetical protein